MREEQASSTVSHPGEGAEHQYLVPSTGVITISMCGMQRWVSSIQRERQEKEHPHKSREHQVKQVPEHVVVHT
jgi:hypothetical protein